MNKLAILLTAAILSGCQSEHAGALREKMSGPEYYSSFTTENHIVEVQYIPRALQVINSSGLEDSVQVTKGLLDSVESALGGAIGICLHLRISPKDSIRRAGFENDVLFGKLNGQRNYRAAFQQYTVGLKEKIWLERNDKKIPMARFQMENSFGLSPSRTFILLFPALAEAEWPGRNEMSLVLDDIVPGLTRQRISWDFSSREI